MMLDSLSINKFRLFKDLTIERLGRVNLIVGNNNSGKTCLLEALLMYASNAAPYWLDVFISERSENWEIETSARNKRQPDNNPLRHLFYERRFPQPGDEGIQIGSFNQPTHRIQLRTRYYQMVENKEGALKRIPIDEHHDLVDVLMALEFQENCDSKPLLLSYVSAVDSGRYFNTPKAKMAVEFVSTSSYKNGERVAELWDNINLTDLKEEVVASLQIIEPSIQDLGLTIGNDKNRFVIVRLKDSKERVSLESMGEGMSRLFHLTLAIVNSSNGLLLIDEFENGLHYTVQPKVWALIFKLANALNVQVFATTHSWDCVTAFQQTTQNSGEDAMLLRLGRSVLKSDNKKVIAIAYDKDKLQVVTQAKLEGAHSQSSRVFS